MTRIKSQKKKKAKELTTAEKTKLVDALKTVVDKAVDEKIRDMAQELLSKFKEDDKEDDKEEKNPRIQKKTMKEQDQMM